MRWRWTVAVWIWVLALHAAGIWFFTSGFLLTRLVLEERSTCAVAPGDEDSVVTVERDTALALSKVEVPKEWRGTGTVEGGCWFPRRFERAVVVVIDALRYDFTVPVERPQPSSGAAGASTALPHYLNAFTVLHELALAKPQHAFLRPFIADPPTSTLQRLKGLTTGTLPTFVDVGSSFAGTAIDEDNLLLQLREAGKTIVHLGDDTWHALFPGYFDEERSRPYDSFNVWDLHTVDNGVLEHIFPLLKPSVADKSSVVNKTDAAPNKSHGWDVLIAHFLGVDHAGHRYGPDHPAMAAKLAQMDEFIRHLVDEIDDDTLLVVLGDHGMDAKGDHGGESDDEVEAALWMYSKKAVFGRTSPENASPPQNAKIRPVSQIDLVPTLALLLGLPIPFNNLGRPIEEAFVGRAGDAWDALAAASRVTAAGIRRYQAAYFKARGVEQAAGTGSPADLWRIAEEAATLASSTATAAAAWREPYDAYSAFQAETLRICKGLWARFDIGSMVLGVVIMVLGVVVLLLYVMRDEDEDLAILEDTELDMAEEILELQLVVSKETEEQPETTTIEPGSSAYNRSVVKTATLGALVGFVGGAAIYAAGHDGRGWPWAGAACAAVCSVGSVFYWLLLHGGKSLARLLPDSLFGWMAVVFTLSQSLGFASNSYTIWEDSITMFFVATFGLCAAIASRRLESRVSRTLATYYAVVFVVLGRLASLSRLCREEQMPYCRSTYYASAGSSTSAPWQLVIPYVVFIVLPSIIRSFLERSRSYEALAPAWIGYVFRTGLFMSAFYWTLDAIDNGNLLPAVAAGLPPGTLKTASVRLAQLVLGLAFVVGTVAFVHAPPNIAIHIPRRVAASTTASNSAATKQTQLQAQILGYGNVHGARYLFLPINMLCACILLSKPMGGGTLALLLWQILCLLEVLDVLELLPSSVPSTKPTDTPGASDGWTIGPVMLALLGAQHFFATGHQATLSSIQWDAAFIPLFSVRYPWTPIIVLLNTLAGQIVVATSVPLLVFWNVGPKRKALLEKLSRVWGAFVAHHAVQALATMAWAGHLRRHLMLYRIFSPRFMTAAAVLLVVDVIGVIVTIPGARSNMHSVAELFGWAD